MKLAYRAFDRTGRAVSATIDAADIHDATDRLRRQGLFIAEIAAGEGDHATGEPGARGRFKGGNLKTLAMFTRQLQVLVSTGTRLVQALEALERQASQPTWRAIIADVRHRVEEGGTFADALSHHPRCFDAIYRSLVSAGESSGKLDEMLQRLGDLTKQQLRLRRSLIGSLIYPTLLLVVAGLVMVLMLVFLLPRFGQLYDTLDVSLPPSTQLMMQASALLRNWWWLVLGVVIAAVVALKFWLASGNGRRAVDTFLVRAPQIGKIVRSLATARLLRVVGVLVESHVPLLEALQLAREASGNFHYRKLISDASEAVTQGETMSSVFAKSPLIEPYVVEAIRNGEQTGQVHSLFLSVAEFLDEENEVIVRSLMSILEPMILIGLGVMVGLIAISMFMPLFDLTAMTESHG